MLAQPAAKKHRLKCLLALVKQLKPENFTFIPTILPEVPYGCFGAQNHDLYLALKIFSGKHTDVPKLHHSSLSQIVLCVKEQNEKTRVAAYKCLTAIGYVYLEKCEDKRAAMKDYFEMIIAGLTGSTHLAG